MAKYIPFPGYHDRAPMDISYLFESEKPAGKHGFLTARGDHFVFEDGTPVRFWGTNLNSGAAFPEKDYAPQLARRLAAYGCNIVRFHQIDSEWATPSIYQYRKGRRLDNTSTYDPESFDRLDYLVSCLKQEGIYIYLDMLTYRKFKEADGVRNSVALIKQGAPYCYFDRRMIELQKEYCKTMWEHYNPYTGLCYKDDPVFVLSEAANEVDLYGCFSNKLVVEPYVSEFRELYRAWCKEQNIQTDVDGCDLNDNTNDALNHFKIKVAEDYHREMFSYMRSLGVKIPFTGLNYSWRFIMRKGAQHIGDFMDSHLNVRFMDWGNGRRWYRDISLHELPEWGCWRNAAHRHFGKPFFTSEWDLTFPDKYRAESPIMMAATGAFQDWGGFTIHTYAYTSLLQHQKLLGKEISADSIGNVGYREGPFATWNDPAKFGLFYHAALIMRRGDVAVAKNRYTVRVDDLSGNDYGQFRPRDVRNAFFASAERHQMGADYYGECPDTISDDTVLVEKTAGEVRSDTGELYRSWEKRYGTVDSPMSKALYGRLGRNGTIALNGLTVRCKNDYAVIALSSLNNEKTIENSDSMLLTTVGVATNTDMKVRQLPGKEIPKDGHEPWMEVLDLGKPPIICEVIEAEISLKTQRKNLVVWAVNAEGIFVGNVPTRYEDGCLKFSLGSKYPSIYYLIQAE